MARINLQAMQRPVIFYLVGNGAGGAPHIC